MMKLKQTVTVTDSEIYYHILASARAFARVTLCGRQTIHKRYDANEHPPTCPDCLTVLQYCKELQIEAAAEAQ